jgi:HK97 family phage major capsid protein
VPVITDPKTPAERKEAIEGLLTECRDIAKAAEDAGRDLTPEERADVMGKLDRCTALKRVDDPARDNAKAVERALEAFTIDPEGAKELNERVLEGALIDGFGRVIKPGKTLADRFLEGPGYEHFKSHMGGKIAGKQRFDLPSTMVGGFKALVTGASGTSAGALVTNDNLGFLGGLQLRRPTIRDVITVGTTGSDTVEYARLTSTTNNAAPVPEATTSATPGLGNVAVGAYTDAHGVKPESAMVFEVVTESVKTIAHFIPATNRALSDAGQLRTLIDTFLRTGLELEVEDQVVNGDGTGQNFTGILTVSGTQAQAWDTDLFVTTRKAITKLETLPDGVVPTAWLFNPADDERIDLATDANDRFYGNGPFGTGPRTLWGVPRISTPVVPAGTGILGDFRYAVLWDREEATITATNSHNDWFVRNLVAILAELRAAFGILRPNAFVEVDLTA